MEEVDRFQELQLEVESEKDRQKEIHARIIEAHAAEVEVCLGRLRCCHPLCCTSAHCCTSLWPVVPTVLLAVVVSCLLNLSVC